MIYTVTFNPSLDYIVKVNNFKLGAVNRTTREDIYAGGKGINEKGIDSEFIKLNEGLSRINVKMKSNEESEINWNGPNITKEALDKLFSKLNTLESGDILVLAGSIPSSLPSDIYEKIMAFLKDKNIKIVVDATKDLLLNVLKYNPFLIKPNNHELGEMFNVELKNDDEIIHYGKKLLDMGAENVLISMASDGAIFLSKNGEVFKSGVPKGVVKNSVGAGDSMVAGFIAGYLKENDLNKAFKMGVATGSASAFSEELATKCEVENLLKQL